jgi:hypothetical protein
MAVDSFTQAVSTVAKLGNATGKRTSLAIYSPATAAATVWIGDSAEDGTTGFPLLPGERIWFTNDGGGVHASQEWFGFASSSVTLQIVEAY